ncbi:MAG: condensation domain-containing protein, partial [Cyclobacteriaceae bacterium]
MPDINHIVEKLADHGIKLKLSGDRLKVKAPQGVMTPILHDLISDNKEELVMLLRELGMVAKINKAAQKPFYPLSSAQRRMFILHEFDKDSVAYNMPETIRLNGVFSPDRLENAFKNLLARHEILRTS